MHFNFQKLRTVLGWTSYICGIVAVAFMWVLLESHYIDGKRIKLEHAAAIAAIEGLLKNKENELKQTSYLLSLSAEFGFSPYITYLVIEEANSRLKPENQSAITWRLIQTPEQLTYIMLSLIYTESAGNPNAIGDGGKARGLTQIWVTTAKDYDEKATAEKLHSPAYNIKVSFDHFHFLLEKYRGNVTMALYAWNRGEGKVDSLLADGYAERIDNGYAQKVLKGLR